MAVVPDAANLPSDAFEHALNLFSLAALNLVNLVDLVAVAVAALALTYLAVFLVKSAGLRALVEANKGDYTKAVLRVVVLLTIVAAALGYVLDHLMGAVACGVGASAAPLLHDVLDGWRSLKRKN